MIPFRSMNEGDWWKWSLAIAGGLSSVLFGGWSEMLGVLALLMGVDYLTGVMAGWVSQSLSSKVGRIGIARKVGMIIVVGLAHGVDYILQAQEMIKLSSDPFRDMCVFFYIANEGISILENLTKIGVPIPDGIRRALAMIHDKAEDNRG